MNAVDVLIVTLFAILTATAAVIARLRGLYEATMLMGLFSLVTASLFVLLDAVDVAFTEAAVGVGVSTVLFLVVLAMTRGRELETPRRLRRWPARIAVLGVGGLLVYAAQDLPEFGSADTPVRQHPLTETYLVESGDQIGIPNTVTSVLASYRGYDTLGELVVIFAAGVAVLLLLSRSPRRNGRTVRREPALADYRVLRVITAMLMPFILLFAFYVQFHGDYGPGGGFQAGVIFASAFVLYGLVFGLGGARRVLPDRVLVPLVAVGVLLYAGVGVACLLAGANFLDYGALQGDSKAGQHLGILLVEAGVGITVAAVMCAVFFAFAGRGASR